MDRRLWGVDANSLRGGHGLSESPRPACARNSPDGHTMALGND